MAAPIARKGAPAKAAPYVKKAAPAKAAPFAKKPASAKAAPFAKKPAPAKTALPAKKGGPATAAPYIKKKGGSTKDLRTLSADFLAAVTGPGEFPSGPPEIAIVGRSNVGKSSLVNALANRHSLARTSKTPGRTQAIILFDLLLSSGDTIRMCDLPGFGHAKVAKTLRESFSPMIQKFLEESKELRGVILLQDCRRDVDEDAIGFAEWLREINRPVLIVATKMDELPKTKRGGVIARLQRDFDLEHPPIATSVRESLGIADLLHNMRRLARQTQA